MRVLKELLSKKESRVPAVIDEKIIFHIARKIITEEYGYQGSENISPILYKNTTLFFSSQSSLWASEIVLKQEYICSRIDKILGEGIVTMIKVTHC